MSSLCDDRSAPPWLRPTRDSRPRLSALLLTALLMLSTSAPAQTIGTVKLDQPWSRATPGGAKVAAGYVTIINSGIADDRLIAVSSDIAGRSQVHEMQIIDNVMKMHEVPGGLTIPAGKEVVLKPMSYHLMFEDLKHPLKQGEHFAAKLIFEKAGALDATFDVDAIGATRTTPDISNHMKMGH